MAYKGMFFKKVKTDKYQGGFLVGGNVCPQTGRL